MNRIKKYFALVHTRVQIHCTEIIKHKIWSSIFSVPNN